MTTSEPGPEDVELYVSPWVSGTRAAAYFGPVSVSVFLPDGEVVDRATEWAQAFETDLLEALKKKAWLMGANSVIAVEVNLDPFAEEDGKVGLKVWAIGTAAKLESLF